MRLTKEDKGVIKRDIKVCLILVAVLTAISWLAGIPGIFMVSPLIIFAYTIGWLGYRLFTKETS